MIEKFGEIPRRGRPGEEGFDAASIVLIECVNDDTPVRLVTQPPAPPPDDIFHYDAMIRRIAQLYSTRFASA